VGEAGGGRNRTLDPALVISSSVGVEGVMRASRLPKRFPAGTKYVVEGKSAGEGQVHIFSRYLVFPDGTCLDLPPGSQQLSSRPVRKHRPGATAAKNAGRPAMLKRARKLFAAAGRRRTGRFGIVTH
jgi:hypothetical protein